MNGGREMRVGFSIVGVDPSWRHFYRTMRRSGYSRDQANLVMLGVALGEWGGLRFVTEGAALAAEARTVALERRLMDAVEDADRLGAAVGALLTGALPAFMDGEPHKIFMTAETSKALMLADIQHRRAVKARG